MSKATHTPGPWTVDPGEQRAMGGERIFKVIQAHSGTRRVGGLIADVSAWWVDTQSAEANARLIAAAPTMLDVLELLRGCETRPPVEGDDEQRTALLVPPQVLEQLCGTLTNALTKAGLL